MRRIYAMYDTFKQLFTIKLLTMSDQEFQAGLPAAMQAAFAAYVAQTSYNATLNTGSVSYTPPVTSAPPVETVSF